MDNSFSLEAGDELSKVSQLYSVDFHGKCREILVPWILWDMFGTCARDVHYPWLLHSRPLALHSFNENVTVDLLPLNKDPSTYHTQKI